MSFLIQFEKAFRGHLFHDQKEVNSFDKANFSKKFVI